jgi:hypothetical protein
MALQYASAERRAEKDVVMLALKNDGMALQWASEALRNDDVVVKAATAQNPDASQFRGDDLQEPEPEPNEPGQLDPASALSSAMPDACPVS